jgi:hypothetical protein
MKKLYHGNKYFRFIGNDFEEVVPEEFSMLEKGMEELNNNGPKCPIYKYGNPSDYFKWIKEDSKPV